MPTHKWGKAHNNENLKKDILIEKQQGNDCHALIVIAKIAILFKNSCFFLFFLHPLHIFGSWTHKKSEQFLEFPQHFING